MLKLFSRITIIFFLLQNFSQGEIIKKIDISGNKRISDETVKVLSQVSLNSNLETKQLNGLLKNLYNSSFFSDVKLSFDNGLLKIVLIENPIIEDIEVIGIRNKSFLENIYENMVLKNRMSFSKEQRNDQLNSVRLKIDIDKGEKARIKEIVFIGDKKIKDKKLLEVIASEEHKFWKFVSNKVYLNESLINLDKRLLKNYYLNQGFYKVEILNSFAELRDENSFKIVFNVNSGEKYSFNDFSLSLPEDYDENDFKKVKKIFKKLKDKKYSINSINQILDEIDNIASSRLYDFIDARVEEKIVDKNKINFNFTVEDSNKYYVERINILGNFQTIEEVIRNRLIVDEGDPYNKLLFNKSIDKLKSSGLFKIVDSKINPGSESSLKIIDLIVEEQPTGEISLGAGVGTGGSTIGGGITEKNFLGKGINLNTNLEISESTVKGQFIYSKPNFAYTDNTLFASVKSITDDNLDDFGYKNTNTGFSVGTSYEQYENLFFSPELDLSFENLETNSSASTNLKKQKGNYEDLYFNYGLDYDLRNSSYKSSAGNKTSFYQQLPMYSDNNEITNTFNFTQYKTLNKSSNLIGKASLYFKAVNSLDGSDVRISKRAQIPYSKLRGFEKGKIGPVENNDYIGGNYVSALNLSTNLPGLFQTVENMDFSYFVDIGNVWGVDYDSSLDASDTIRSSTGIALDLITPVGPLSFSLTQPITKKSTDKTESFRFNLGTTF